MYLGIDIGTSSVKAVLVDEAQSVVDEASAPLTVSRPHPLWSEQDPQDWWQATSSAVTQLNADYRRAVKAIGHSGQMHGATLLDAAGEVLRPAILWNDGRSHEACRKMTEALPELEQISGNLAMPGFTAPKLHWVRENEPEIFKRVAKVLLPKDYVRYRMTGEFASDMSDSAGTLWMDVGARDWSDALLNLTGLDRSHMPALFEGPDVTGQLSSSLASVWGMQTVPVVAGAGDNAAGAIGSGVINPGDGFVSLGTSGVVFVADNGFHPNVAGSVHTFCHALPKRWHRMSVILSAASAIDFVADMTGFQSAQSLHEQVNERAQPNRQVLFLPYLSGERTPHNDPHATGAFFGLTHTETPVSLAQAALEGVAFALADGVDVLKQAGTRLASFSVIGGGSRSEWWGRVIASAANMPLIFRESASVGPAFGAARLARLSVTGEDPSDVCVAPPESFTVEPDPELVALYSERRALFSQLYQATRDLRL
ncbi:MAG: xylulokinase [Pseudomonadota bacterium]